MNGFVSVIVPVYNGESYISSCVDSLLAQTYEKIEIIIIDDGSADSTKEKVENYAKENEKIRYKRIKNSGVSQARNIGIEMAQGEYLFFVDADDYLDKDTVKRAVEEAFQENADMVTVLHQEVFGKFRKISKKYTKKEILTGSCAVHQFLRTDKIGWETWGKLMKREVVGKKRFPVGRSIAEDAEFVFCVLLDSKKVILLNEPLYFYRISESSAMAQNFSEKNFGTLEAVNQIADLAKNHANENDISFFVLKYHIWFLRFYFQKSERKKRKKLKQQIKIIRSKVKAVSCRDAYKELSKKYFLEYLLICYFFFGYGFLLDVWFYYTRWRGGK